MAKFVFCLVLAVTMVLVANARLIPDGDGDFRHETYHQPGRLVSSESFGSTEVLQGDNYQTSLYDQSSRGAEFGDFYRVQDDATTSTTTNSFSDAFATDTFSNSFSEDTSFSNSFSTDSGVVNPTQGVRYNYASDSVNYEKGLTTRSAGVGTIHSAASFTLEGNTEKSDSAEWTESDP